MKPYYALSATAFLIITSLWVNSENQASPPDTEMEWISIKPVAVSTASYESPNRIHCYLGLSYELNGIRDVGVAMTVHCGNIVAVAALLKAEIADDDAEEIKLAIHSESSGDYRNIRRILINGINYNLGD